MNISDRTLNFVFADDAKKPLLVGCYWEKGKWSQPLPLLNEHVGRGKPRRDALCILFLLAKYRAVEMKCPHEVLEFKVHLEEQTWIGTLGDAYKNRGGQIPIRKWVGEHFLIGESDHFFSGHSGSDRTEGGKSPRRVEYRTKQFPPQNLNFFFQNANCPSDKLRPFSQDELFNFAVKLEAYQWTESESESGIWELVRKGILILPEQYAESDVAGLHPLLNPRLVDKMTADESFALLQKDIEELEEYAPESLGYKQDLTIIQQIKKEFGEYQTTCEPFFSYMSGWSNPLIYHEGFAINNYQARIMQETSLHYADIVTDGATKIFKTLRRQFGKEVDILSHRPECDRELLIAIESIFLGFAQRCELNPIRLKALKVLSKKFYELEHFNLEQGKIASGLNAWVALGAYTAQRAVFHDFLIKVCAPHFNPRQIDNDALSSFYNNCENVRIEASQAIMSRHSFCKLAAHHFDYVLGLRALLKKQAVFWVALHEEIKRLAH